MKQYEKLSVEMLANSEGWKPRFVISDFVAMLSEDSAYAIDMDSLGDKIHHPCTCSEIIDAKWQAMKDTQWNS